MFTIRMFGYIEVLFQASFPYISRLPRINLGEQKIARYFIEVFNSAYDGYNKLLF